VNLHPEVVLDATLARHKRAFALVHGGLELAIQRACVTWADDFHDLRQVKGGVLAGDIRQWLLRFLEGPEFTESSMRAAAGPNCSVVLSDAEGEVAAVRKHPRSYVTGELTAVTEIPATTLFGIDYSQLPWEPYLLWDIDLGRQSLRRAWLAAVAGIDDPSGAAVIYYKIELPPAIIAVRQPPPPDPGDADGWGDEFVEEGEGSGDPA
jgi:hypothetical protein